jgi:uncharacterized repeat protein (TIGR03803 family)
MPFRKTAFVLGLSLAVCAGGAQASHRIHTLHRFYGLDGRDPSAPLILDNHGNLYGTTQYGGVPDNGTVFKLAPDGTKTLLADFPKTSDGTRPVGELLRDVRGDLFGTTSFIKPYARQNVRGALFKVDKKDTLSILHTFTTDDPAGYEPLGGVIGNSGILYGTTFTGGAGGGGTVFSFLQINGGYLSVLHTFHPENGDAGNPTGSLTLDVNGNLYGTAAIGGSGKGANGAVFKIAPDGTYSLVYTFGAYSMDGQTPKGGVTLDGDGNIYGTTFLGGSAGDGTVFKIAPDGTETLLHSFDDIGTHEGKLPNGHLVVDAKGNLYGTTSGGGEAECGTLFKIARNGDFQVLHTFANYRHSVHKGCAPMAGLTIDKKGNLYGTTSYGGDDLKNLGAGTVFEIDAE